MRGIFSKGIFECNALRSPPDGCARKREQAFPFPQQKRQKVLGPIFQQQSPCVSQSSEDDESNTNEDAVDEGVQIESKHSHGEEKSCVCPSVVYEGDVAMVKLGVGQMVILDGCAMVQVVEGQATMLGYSFPRGTDILVCSSSKLGEVTIIRARHGVRDGRPSGTDATMRQEGGGSLRETDLGCQLRFVSHSLGQQMVASGGTSLSFGLEVVGALGSSLGKKRRWEVFEHQGSPPDSSERCSDGDELSLDSEARFSDSVEDGDERRAQVLVRVEDGELDATAENVKKRNGYGRNRGIVKRQRVVEMLNSHSSTTPQGWKEAVETITLGSGAPVIAIAVQGMFESLRLLGSQ